MNVVSEIAQTFFNNTWKLFTQTKVPGLDVSFAALLVALIIVRISLALFSYLSGFGSPGTFSYGRAAYDVRKLNSLSRKQSIINERTARRRGR